jgi:putative DNA primase/helicase
MIPHPQGPVKVGAAMPRLTRSKEEGLADGRACLEAALRYLALGWHVLADCPPDHVGVGRGHGRDCDHPGKAPLVRWKELQQRPPSVQEARDWWHTWPNANVGVALGQLLRIDVDGPDGENLLQRLCRGDLPATLEFDSGRDNGGRGLLYAAPPGIVLRTSVEGASIGQELRLQAHGAQTVLPPSRHPSGSYYAWRPGRSPGKVSVASAPAWLVEALQVCGGRKVRTASVQDDTEPIEKGKRDTVLTSLAGTMRRRGFSQAAIAAALQVTNEERCDPPLDPSQVEKIAESVARYSPEAVPAILVRCAPAPPRRLIVPGPRCSRCVRFDGEVR